MSMWRKQTCMREQRQCRKPQRCEVNRLEARYDQCMPQGYTAPTGALGTVSAVYTPSQPANTYIGQQACHSLMPRKPRSNQALCNRSKPQSTHSIP
eukprot:6463330-Amphidinium_carterae.1